MAETKITMSPNDVDNIISEYAKQKAASAQITVELSGVNEVDPLTLLRVMNIANPSIDDLVAITETVLNGRTINFKYGEQEIFHPVTFNKGAGNSLHLMFADAPYLYDILQQTVYALLLKKLTPHLEGSN